MKDPVFVTQSYLPNLSKYYGYLQKIWENKQLTNNGPFVQELERRLKQELETNNLLYCNNGTIVLQMALKALPLEGEIITTPFSYVATTNSIMWEGFTPVFVDISESDFNIDTSKIEQKVNDKTRAILATHVFGNPCDVNKIEEIAKRHNLIVIYDAAHAFAVKYLNQSLFNYGDMSTCSFHATKVFHTGEGGAIFCKEEQLYKKLHLMRQFGHIGDDYYAIGINGKSSEFHAALGLCVLDDFEYILSQRKQVTEYYDAHLDMIRIKRPKAIDGTVYNYAYYPVVLESEETLLNVMEALKAQSIFPRRYFYPSLNTLNFVPHQTCPISESISKRILCLPLSAEYNESKLEEIVTIVNNELKK